MNTVNYYSVISLRILTALLTLAVLAIITFAMMCGPDSKPIAPCINPDKPMAMGVK